MKIKDGFVLREIVGSWIVVPTGKRVVELCGLISLSESGAMLWNVLGQGADEQMLVSTIMKEYNIDETVARKDVKEYITSLIQNELLEQSA